MLGSRQVTEPIYILRARKAYLARRKAKGMERVNIWMSPETRAMLSTLVEGHGNQETAIAYAIRKALGEVE